MSVSDRLLANDRPLPATNGNGPAPARDWLFWVVPALDSLRTYSLGSLRLDLFAGLTVAAVAVPQAMAEDVA